MSLSPPEKGPLAARTRFLLLILVVICLTLNWANILTFNFTVICMQPADNTTVKTESHPFNREFTNSEKSQAMGVAAAGALLANVPILVLINWYGPRYVFTLVGIFGSISTALIPFALQMGFRWFLVVRAMQGIAFAGDMATFGHFITYWTYYKQYAFFTATLCTYVQLAPVFTNPLSGILCDSQFGWPSVYYVHAVVGVFFFVLFFICYRNHPEKHPFVSEIELQKITRGHEELNIEAAKHVPYWDICKSLPVWAVFIGSIGNYCAINLVLQFTPTYLNKVQDFPVVETGFLAPLPPLLEAFMKELSGLSNDRIPAHIMGETMKTKVYSSIAFFSQAAFFVILSFIPPGQGLWALLCFIAGSSMLGFNTGGFYKSGSLISGPYAPFVMGQISTGMTVSMLIVPLFVNALTPTNSHAEWALAFYAIAGIVVGCNIFYCIFAKGELCYWAKSDYFQKRKAKLQESKAKRTNTIHLVEEDKLPQKSLTQT